MFGHVWDWQLGSCSGMYWPLSGCFPWSSVDPQSHSPRYSLSGCYTATLACSWPDAVARLCRIVWGCLGLWIVMVRSDRDAADLSNSGAETVAVLTWGWVLTRGLWTISLLIKKFSSWLVRFFGGFTFERGRIPSWAHVWWLWGSSWMRCSTQKRPRQVEWYRTWHKAQKSNCTLIIIINNILYISIYLHWFICFFVCLICLFIYLCVYFFIYYFLICLLNLIYFYF